MCRRAACVRAPPQSATSRSADHHASAAAPVPTNRLPQYARSLGGGPCGAATPACLRFSTRTAWPRVGLDACAARSAANRRAASILGRDEPLCRRCCRATSASGAPDCAHRAAMLSKGPAVPALEPPAARDVGARLGHQEESDVSEEKILRHVRAGDWLRSGQRSRCERNSGLPAALGEPAQCRHGYLGVGVGKASPERIGCELLRRRSGGAPAAIGSTPATIEWRASVSSVGSQVFASAIMRRSCRGVLSDSAITDQTSFVPSCLVWGTCCGHGCGGIRR